MVMRADEAEDLIDLQHKGQLLVRTGALDPSHVAHLEPTGVIHVKIHRKQVAAGIRRRLSIRRQLHLEPAIEVVDRVPRVTEVDVQIVDAFGGFFTVQIDFHVGRDFAAGDERGVIEQPHLIDVRRRDSLAADEHHGVPGDGRVLRGVETHRAVERVVVLDIERQRQAGEVRPRQVLQAQVVEVIVGVVQAQDRGVFGGLENARDRHTGRGGVVERCSRGAPGEALQLEVPPGIEDAKRFSSHGKWSE